MSDSVTQLENVLKSANLRILKYDPHKDRSVKLSTLPACTIEKFSSILKNDHLDKLIKNPEVIDAVGNPEVMGKLLLRYSEKKKVLVQDSVIEIPEEWRDLTLNFDYSHQGRDLKFYVTTPAEELSKVSGTAYIRMFGIKDEDALGSARRAVPVYLPRHPKGVVTLVERGTKISAFNTYLPPEWMGYKGDLPDKLPVLFKKLVRHLFPLAIEREFFFAWLYESLFNRAPTFLILCGVGGAGKNRLKLVMRALHDHENTVDGKRSTLTKQFNSQLADSTLAWFDELSYDMETENVMKEIQNDSISIERKGVDATRSTKIYASLVISNNKPRDNYIALDARKFVPLKITNKRLDTSMTVEEMDLLTKKVENRNAEEFDLAFIAQIGRWIKNHGQSDKWPGMEYKGPMFYKLAHTSMTRWQKKAVHLLLSGTSLNSSRIIFDEDRGYLWSSVAEASMKKHMDRSLHFPEHSTVMAFFNMFVGEKGEKVFVTTPSPNTDINDFYVSILNRKAKFLEESDDDEEVYDL